MLSHLSNEELMERVAGAEEGAAYAAFEELRRRYWERLVGLFRRKWGDVRDEHPDDLALAVMVRVWKFRKTFGRVKGRTFEAWLFRIGTNVGNDAGNRQKRRAAGEVLHAEVIPVSDDEEMPEPEAPESSDPAWVVCGDDAAERLRQELARALDAMSEDHRTAFLLYTRDGLSYQDISLRMHHSLANVKTHIFRARLRIQRHLEGKGLL